MLRLTLLLFAICLLTTTVALALGRAGEPETVLVAYQARSDHARTHLLSYAPARFDWQPFLPWNRWRWLALSVGLVGAACQFARRRV